MKRLIFLIKSYFNRCVDCKDTGIWQTYNIVDPMYERVCSCPAGEHLRQQEYSAVQTAQPV